jgi:hypothetical protein
MTEKSFRARSFVWFLAALIASAMSACPSAAKNTNKTTVKFETVFTSSDPTANYVRILIPDFLKDSLIQAETLGTINRGKGNVAVVIPLSIDPKRIASFVPKVGNTLPKPGFIDFILGIDLTKTFQKGDKVELTMTFNGDVAGKFKPSSASFRSGIGMGFNETNVLGAMISGFTSKFDPQYTAINDLDPLIYGVSDPQFEIHNLQFFGNVDQSFLSTVDLNAIFNAPFDPSLPNFTLSSEQAGAPSFPTSMVFNNPFQEPGPGNFAVELGQVYDPNAGAVVSAFCQTEQIANVPEPSSGILICIGALGTIIWRNCLRRATS